MTSVLQKPTSRHQPDRVVLTHDGRAAEAIDYMQRCRKLDPFYPPRFNFHLAHAHYLLGHHEVALGLSRTAVRRKPDFQGAHAWHAAAAAQLGHDNAARAALAELARFQPQLTITKFLGLVRYAKTQSHFDFAAEVIAEVKDNAASIRRVRIVKQPKYLRHFTCECAWVDG